MKLIFLDRDGVINKYPGDTKYVTDWSEFEFLPGALDAIKKLTENNFKIFIISNQAGVSQEIYTQEKLDQITSGMLKAIKDKSGKIQAVFYCTHKEEDNCSCRKPKTGLIEKAIESLGLKKFNLNYSYFIGDSVRDIKTGKSAGLKTILVFSGKERKENKNKLEIKPNYEAKDLKEAVNIILNENPHHICHGRSGPSPSS